MAIRIDHYKTIMRAAELLGQDFSNFSRGAALSIAREVLAGSRQFAPAVLTADELKTGKALNIDSALFDLIAAAAKLSELSPSEFIQLCAFEVATTYLTKLPKTPRASLKSNAA